MKATVAMKRKDRPRKQRIRSFLKQIAREESAKMIPFIILTVDFLDDGMINASFLGDFLQ